MKLIGDRRKIAACVASALALTLACAGLATCSAEPEPPIDGAHASERPAESRFAASAEASSGAPEGRGDAKSASSDGIELQFEQPAEPPAKTTSQDAVSGLSAADSQTNPSAEEAAPTPDPAPSGGESQEQPVWVPDFEDVWVEDSPGWDESVPVYGYVEVSICNVCGADVTGNAAAHGKQHMLAGEGSGHHSEVHEIVVGYETIHHGAEGHWERVESDGHWE